MAIDVEKIANAIVDGVATVLKPLAARVKALEARPAMSWRGPWSPAEEYRAGDCVQRSKGLFVCIADAGEDDLPGTSERWRRLAFTD